MGLGNENDVPFNVHMPVVISCYAFHAQAYNSSVCFQPGEGIALSWSVEAIDGHMENSVKRSAFAVTHSSIRQHFHTAQSDFL